MASKELEPADVTAVIDSREQLPYDLAPLKSTTGSLATGDYSVLGLESVVSIERKSLEDFLGCVGGDRERFEREMHRILAYPCRALVIEATWQQLMTGDWRHRVSPAAVVGSALGWMMAGVPVFLAGSRAEAQAAVSRMLFLAARRRWREAVSLVPTLRIVHK